MRVCLITDYLSPTYGWGRHALGIIRALRDLGVSIRLLSPRGTCAISRTSSAYPTTGACPRSSRKHGGCYASPDARCPPSSRRAGLRCDPLPHRAICRPGGGGRGGRWPAAAAGDRARHVCHSPADATTGSLVAGVGLPPGGAGRLRQQLHPRPAARAAAHGQDRGGAGGHRGGAFRIAPPPSERALSALGGPDQTAQGLSRNHRGVLPACMRGVPTSSIGLPEQPTTPFFWPSYASAWPSLA